MKENLVIDNMQENKVNNKEKMMLQQIDAQMSRKISIIQNIYLCVILI